jgi:hypothetical protein
MVVESSKSSDPGGRDDDARGAVRSGGFGGWPGPEVGP